MPTTVALGDEYITADYTYKYGYFFFHHMIAKWHQFTNAMNGWGVVVNDQSKTAYEPLLESINGKKLVSLQECYRDCTNLIAAPVIPDSVQDTTSDSCIRIPRQREVCFGNICKM